MLCRIRDTLKQTVLQLRARFFCCGLGYDLHPSVIVSWSAYFDKTHPARIMIGDQMLMTRGVTISFPRLHPQCQSKNSNREISPHRSQCHRCSGHYHGRLCRVWSRLRPSRARFFPRSLITVNLGECCARFRLACTERSFSAWWRELSNLTSSHRQLARIRA